MLKIYEIKEKNITSYDKKKTFPYWFDVYKNNNLHSIRPLSKFKTKVIDVYYNEKLYAIDSNFESVKSLKRKLLIDNFFKSI